MKKHIMMALVAMALGTLSAADERTAAKSASRFAPPPDEAVKALRVTVGKPFNAGYVFVDGKYLAPPYKVERYGTVIRVNGIQVSRQIVPWEEFVKTQSGAKAVKSEAPAEAADAAPAAAAPEAPTPAVAAKSQSSDDDDASLDDLFDDAPASKPKKQTTSASAAVSPRPRRQPAASVSYVLEGPFAMNEKARALLNRVNDVRTRIDKQLRSGGYFCFSSSYSMISGDSGGAKRILDKLPDVMKNYNEREAFVMGMNRAGLSYMPVPLMNDFFKNRLDYLKLVERKRADQNRHEWSALLDNL